MIDYQEVLKAEREACRTTEEHDVARRALDRVLAMYKEQRDETKPVTAEDLIQERIVYEARIKAIDREKGELYTKIAHVNARLESEFDMFGYELEDDIMKQVGDYE